MQARGTGAVRAGALAIARLQAKLIACASGAVSPSVDGEAQGIAGAIVMASASAGGLGCMTAAALAGA